MEEKINVMFSGGKSRKGEYAVNFMLAKYEDEDGDEQELYAEYDLREISDEDYFADTDKYDDESFKVLKEEILRQADEAGIAHDRLEFWGE